MNVIVKLRRQQATVLQGAVTHEGANPADVESVARRFGAELRQQHPGISEPELASYYVVSSASPAQAEEMAAALQRLDSVDAAYVEPPVSPA